MFFLLMAKYIKHAHDHWGYPNPLELKMTKEFKNHMQCRSFPLNHISPCSFYYQMVCMSWLCEGISDPPETGKSKYCLDTVKITPIYHIISCVTAHQMDMTHRGGPDSLKQEMIKYFENFWNTHFKSNILLFLVSWCIKWYVDHAPKDWSQSPCFSHLLSIIYKLIKKKLKLSQGRKSNFENLFGDIFYQFIDPYDENEKSETLSRIYLKLNIFQENA